MTNFLAPGDVFRFSSLKGNNPQAYAAGAFRSLLPGQQPQLFGMVEPDTLPLSTYDAGLTPKQQYQEIGAETELQRNLDLFESIGKREDFEAYAEREGRIGPIESLDRESETALTGAFDLLSSGLYTVAGLTQELIRTGSVDAAFKQAAIEFANAMPGIEISSARRPGWGDVFGEFPALHGSRWLSASLGLVADLVLDPINLIPGAKLAQVAAKGSRRVGRLMPTVVKDLHNKLFVPKLNREMAGLGEAGERFKQLFGISKATREQETIRWLDKVEKRLGMFRFEERALLGMAYENPQFLKDQFRELNKAGVFEVQDWNQIDEAVDRIKQLSDEMFQLETSPAVPFGGLIDPQAFKQNYLMHTTPLFPEQRRLFEKIAPTSAAAGGGGPGSVGKVSFGQQQSYPTVYDRLVAVLSGNISMPIELDVGNMMRRRAMEHVKYIESSNLAQQVVSDPRIGAVQVDAARQQLFGRSKTAWAKYRANVQRQQPGMDVLEIRRWRRVPYTTKKGVQKIKTQEVLVDAYVLPEPMVRYLTKGEEVLKMPESMEKLVNAIGTVTSFWKGGATLGTGYHLRNITSSGFTNWLKGLGNGSGKEFVTRYAQAIKLQSIADGQGKLPASLARNIQNQLGRPLGNLQLPRLSYQGRVLTDAEVVDVAEKFGVLTKHNRLLEVPEEATRQLWQGADSVMLKVDQSTADPFLQVGMGIMRGEKGSRLGKLGTNIRGDFQSVLNSHRALATTTDNTARLASFIDDWAKLGDPWLAALETKKWHFDYSTLTEAEKLIMGNLLPFYAWTRFSGPRMFMALLEMPARVAKVPKLKRAIESLSGDWQDIPTPDYFEEVQAIQLPFVINDKPLFAQVDLPLNELNRFNWQDVRSSLNPLLKLLMETAPEGGVNFLTGSPIERFPGEASETMPWMSRLAEHRLSNLLPVLNRFMFRPKAAWQQGEIGAYVAAEMTGIRFRSVDVRRVTRAQTFERRKLARDYRRRLEQQGLLNGM